MLLAKLLEKLYRLAGLALGQVVHLQIEMGDLQAAVANDRAAVAKTPRADAYYDLGKALALRIVNP